MTYPTKQLRAWQQVLSCPAALQASLRCAAWVGVRASLVSWNSMEYKLCLKNIHFPQPETCRISVIFCAMEVIPSLPEQQVGWIHSYIVVEIGRECLWVVCIGYYRLYFLIQFLNHTVSPVSRSVWIWGGKSWLTQTSRFRSFTTLLLSVSITNSRCNWSIIQWDNSFPTHFPSAVSQTIPSHLKPSKTSKTWYSGVLSTLALIQEST